MSTRRAELLDAALKYVLAHGIGDLSLRPLATALDTSPRMLMFHFKSKEGLLKALTEALRERLEQSFRKQTQAADGDEAPLVLCWTWAARRENLPYLQLLYEIQALAARSSKPFRQYMAEVANAWQRLTYEAMSEALRDKAMVTLCIAVFDGLMLELINGGRRADLLSALNRFVALARAGVAQKS